MHSYISMKYCAEDPKRAAAHTTHHQEGPTPEDNPSRVKIRVIFAHSAILPRALHIVGVLGNISR